MNEVRQDDIFGLAELEPMHPFFRTWIGKKVGKWLLKFFRITRANDLNRQGAGMTPWDSAEKMMKLMGVSVIVENEHLLDTMPVGSYITVSNHVYGSIDGIALTHIMGKRRPDFKMVVNDILIKIYSLSGCCIGVKPQIGFQKEQKHNTQGLKDVLTAFREGRPVCLFPAGAVSMYEDRDFIADREWQESAIKMVKIAKVPVFPIFFHGYNSKFFYFLEKIHIALRTPFMAREAFNKQGYTMKITVGNPISLEEQSRCTSIAELGLLLRNRTYELSGDSRLFTRRVERSK